MYVCTSIGLAVLWVCLHQLHHEHMSNAFTLWQAIEVFQLQYDVWDVGHHHLILFLLPLLLLLLLLLPLLLLPLPLPLLLLHPHLFLLLLLLLFIFFILNRGHLFFHCFYRERKGDGKGERERNCYETKPSICCLLHMLGLRIMGTWTGYWIHNLDMCTDLELKLQLFG